MRDSIGPVGKQVKRAQRIVNQNRWDACAYRSSGISTRTTSRRLCFSTGIGATCTTRSWETSPLDWLNLIVSVVLSSQRMPPGRSLDHSGCRGRGRRAHRPSRRSPHELLKLWDRAIGSSPIASRSPEGTAPPSGARPKAPQGSLAVGVGHGSLLPLVDELHADDATLTMIDRQITLSRRFDLRS